MQGEIQTFLAHLAGERSRSANTIAAYRNDLGQFHGYLVSSPALVSSTITAWHDLAEETIAAYLDFLHARTMLSTLAQDGGGAQLPQPPTADRSPRRGSDTCVAAPQSRKESTTDDPCGHHRPAVGRARRGRSPKSLRDKALLEVLCATGMASPKWWSSIWTMWIPAHTPSSAGRAVCGCKSGHPLRRRGAGAAPLHRTQAPALTKADGEQALFVNHRGQRLARQGLWLIIRQYAAAVGIADNITPTRYVTASPRTC
ncbi:MAG: site-specific integrase [Caldilineaceae bacterium]